MANTTTYTVPDYTGRGTHAQIVVTAAERAAFGDQLASFFTAGVERYGSVDEFARALSFYNALEAAS